MRLRWRRRPAGEWWLVDDLGAPGLALITIRRVHQFYWRVEPNGQYVHLDGREPVEASRLRDAKAWALAVAEGRLADADAMLGTCWVRLASEAPR